MCKLNLVAVFLISLVSIGLINSAYSGLTSSSKLSSQGSINYGGPTDPHMGLTLKYSTDFEDVVKAGDSLSMSIANMFVFDGGTAWMEGYDQDNGITPHSGTRCLGQALTGGGNPPRNEWDTNEWSWASSNIWYFQKWVYFPTSFSVSSGDWFEFFEFDDSLEGPNAWHPFVGVSLFGTSNPSQPNLGFLWTNDHYGGDFSKSLPWNIIRGQWFKVGIYINRGTSDTHDATAKLWINDELWISINSGEMLLKQSQHNGNQLWFNPAKMYTWYATPNKMWTDDLEIYGQ